MVFSREFWTTFIISIRFGFNQGSYRLSNDQSRWNDSDCDMASPDIHLDSVSGRYVLIDSSLLTPDMNSSWIGYYQVPVGFENIGCMKKDEVTKGTETFPINGDPSHCAFACKYPPIIGVSNYECFCLDMTNINKSDTTKDNCNAECSELPGVACGDSRGGHISVYRNNTEVTKQAFRQIYSTTNDIALHCLALELTPKEYSWRGCALSLAWMCLNGDKAEVYKHNEQYEYRRWIENSQHCLKENRVPVPYQHTLMIGHSGGSPGPLWTGVFKANVTFDLRENPVADGIPASHIKHGVLIYNPMGNSYISFVDSDRETHQFTLCNDDGKVSSTVNTVSGVSKETTSVVNSTLPALSQSTVSDSNRVMQPTEESDGQQNNKEVVIGVVVGVVVGVVIIVFIIIVVVLIKRYGSTCRSRIKDRNNINKSNKDTNQNQQNYSYSAEHPYELEPTGSAQDIEYAEPDELNASRTINDSTPTYSCVDKSNIKTKASKQQQPDIIVFNGRTGGQRDGSELNEQLCDNENAYDTTKMSKENRDLDSNVGNIYNKLGVNEDEYATTKQHAEGGGRTAPYTDNIYNHFVKSESEYDTTNSNVGKAASGKATSYSHKDDFDQSNAETDDTAVGAVQDFTDDIYDKTSSEQDDTYSHLHSNSGAQNVHTDNVYGSYRN